MRQFEPRRTQRAQRGSERVNELTETIIGCAIKVHRVLGPGLLEKTYQVCLTHELQKAGLAVLTEVVLPVVYDGVRLEAGYRIDILVEDKVIVELITVERVLPIHEAQLISYLKLSGKRVGLLINFNVRMLVDGVRRLAN